MPLVWSGVVSSADSRATAAGRAILAKGGSASDAAMAMMLVLTLVEPQSSGVGGGGFLLYHEASSNRLVSLDGRETAPSAARAEQFLDAKGHPLSRAQAIPGGLSVGVPGNIRLMEKAHQRWGKLSWSDLFGPAIRLAEEGFLVTPVLHTWLVRFEAGWQDFPDVRALYYVDGKPAPVGTRIRNPAYARLLRAVAARGGDAFYTGRHAEAIVEAVADAPRHAATLTLEDLAAYRAKERPAVCTTYRGHSVCGMGPPSSGATTVFAILGLIEGYDMAAMGKDSPMSWHLIAEAMQLAYADRRHYLGDADFVDVPVAGLIDKAYLARRRQAISPFKAAGSYAHGKPPGALARTAPPPINDKGTSHFVAADREGNVASMTSTIESLFGSRLIANGFFLNNEMTDFSFVPEENGAPVANQVAPGKRPLSSMSPTIVYGPDGKVRLAVGSAGGKRIIMHVAKTLIGVIDWNLSAAQAIALPNLYYSGGGVLIEDTEAGRVLAEKMAVFGRSVTPRNLGSKLNAVEQTESGWRGAADPRGPGTWSKGEAPPQG